tara:strand:+ start:133 stop:519 length:387 start_codon:yes stop_codon:yes gene_type:complete
MANFAKLKQGNIVERVEAVSNNVATTEQAGIDFLKELYNEPNAVWVQTSYNENFRKNYAGIGFTYDATRNAFIPPKPFNSWLLNETTCRWEAPVARPTTYDDGIVDADNNPVADKYVWNEAHHRWDKF